MRKLFSRRQHAIRPNVPFLPDTCSTNNLLENLTLFKSRRFPRQSIMMGFLSTRALTNGTRTDNVRRAHKTTGPLGSRWARAGLHREAEQHCSKEAKHTKQRYPTSHTWDATNHQHGILSTVRAGGKCASIRLAESLRVRLPSCC